jgi:hypothetical protein
MCVCVCVRAVALASYSVFAMNEISFFEDMHSVCARAPCTHILMSGGRCVPWTYWNEWVDVYNQLYSASAETRRRGIEHVGGITLDQRSR